LGKRKGKVEFAQKKDACDERIAENVAGDVTGIR
jgi:hypothetical protein